MRFEILISQWQPFFTTIAAVSATLVGLLFVSLSINREKITADANRELLRLAQRTFADFLLVLLIAILFLIPNQPNTSLAVEMFLLGILRIRWLFRRLIRTDKDAPRHTTTDSIREYLLPVLSVLGLFAAAVKIHQSDVGGVYWFVVPVIAFLLFRASWNAWLLLVLEKK
jgi:hypothetical protein